MAKFNPEDFNKVVQSKGEGQVPPPPAPKVGDSDSESVNTEEAKRGGINYMVVVVTVIVVALSLAALWVFVLDKGTTPEATPKNTQTQTQTPSDKKTATPETEETATEFDKNEITQGVRGNAGGYTDVDTSTEKSNAKSGEGCDVSQISYECSKEGVTADDSVQVNMYLGYYMFQPQNTSTGEARVAAESKDGYRILITKDNAGVIARPSSGMMGETMRIVGMIAPKDTYMHDDVKATLDGISGREGVFIPYGTSVVYGFDDTSKKIIEEQFPLS